MPLRVRKAQPSLRRNAAPYPCELVSAMTFRMCRTFIASLGLVALVLAASETLADPGVARGGGVAPAAPTFRSSAGRSMHHHRGIGGLPTAAGYFYGPSYDDEPAIDAVPPRTSNDIHYTCTLDIPWDYVHRCPQPVSPRD